MKNILQAVFFVWQGKHGSPLRNLRHYFLIIFFFFRTLYPKLPNFRPSAR